MTRSRGSQLLMAAFVAVFTGVACGSSDSSGGISSDSAEIGAPQPAAYGAGAEDAAAGGGDASSAFYSTLPSAGLSVIKTAGIELEVARDGFDDAVQDAVEVAGAHGGFVLSTSVEDDRHKQAMVVIRVPSETFEAALADVESLGDVTEEEVTGKDVSEEFIDLDARLRNLRAQEAVLLRLMDRSHTIGHTIRVQREIQPLQLEMERIQGRLRYLEDQTTYSTISVSFTEAGAVVAKPGVLERAWDSSVTGFLGIASAAILAAGWLLPFAVLAGVVLIVLRLALPRLLRKASSA